MFGTLSSLLINFVFSQTSGMEHLLLCIGIDMQSLIILAWAMALNDQNDHAEMVKNTKLVLSY